MLWQLISPIPLHPTASIWNRAHGEADESHQKVMVQLERIKGNNPDDKFIPRGRGGGGNSRLLLLSQQKHETQTNQRAGSASSLRHDLTEQEPLMCRELPGGLNC